MNVEHILDYRYDVLNAAFIRHDNPGPTLEEVKSCSQYEEYWVKRLDKMF